MPFGTSLSGIIFNLVSLLKNEEDLEELIIVNNLLLGGRKCNNPNYCYNIKRKGDESIKIIYYYSTNSRSIVIDYGKNENRKLSAVYSTV